MGNSAFLMSMTLRLFPSILASCYNIIEAEKLRGGSINDRSLKKRIKYQGNVVNILFMTCLEDSADMAESMYSRGFGTGKRSIYFSEAYSKYDFILLIIIVILIITFGLLQIKGFNDFIFYPQIDNIIKKLSIQGIFVTLLLYIPAVVNWGWNLEGSRNK
jgi:energy-coupling factor transport system permease protein